MVAKIGMLAHLRLAGSVVLDQANTEFPLNPQVGTLIIKDQNLFAYLVVNGLETWFPMGRANASYVHTQLANGLVWTVEHNLNSGDLWYQVQDENGEITWPSSVVRVDANTMEIHFSEAVKGSVLVVGASSIDVPEVKASIINVGGLQITSTGITLNGSPLTGGAGNASVTYEAPAAALEHTVSHGLGKRWPTVSVYNMDTGRLVIADVRSDDDNQITVFTTPATKVAVTVA